MPIKESGDKCPSSSNNDAKEHSKSVTELHKTQRKKSKFNFGDPTDYFAIRKPTKRLEEGGDSLDKKVFPTFVKGLRVSFNELIEPDIKIKIAKKNFNCSHILLATFINYFQCVKVGTKEICLSSKKVSAVAFEFIYEWMSENKSIISMNILLKVYKAALYLEISKLVEQIWYHFKNQQLFTEELAFEFYKKSTKKGLAMVKNLMVTRISKYFLVAVSSAQYLSMPLADVIKLLSSDQLAVCNEIQVFYAAVRWLNFDKERRKKDILTVVKCVRFGLICPKVLVKLQTDPEKVFKKIIKNKDVTKLIHNALTRNCIFLDIPTEENVEELLEEFGMGTTPRPREWLSDHYFKHHDKQGCKQWQDASYEDFESYLEYLREDPGCWRQFVPVKDINQIP